MDLQDYERIKFELADILRSTPAASRSDNQRAAEAVRDLFSRIAEDRFNLVVVGRFSRGKTSLMNALLGTDRLPTGVIPLTSVITTVTYGSEERVTLYYKNTSLFMDIPRHELSEYITERGNPGNAKGIRTAEVQLPVEILRRGFFFIDTPGLGSSIIENSRTTEAFLPEADAFILVTSFDSPLSEEERRILEMTRVSNRRVFVVLNKQDTVAPNDREEVENHLRSQLRIIFKDAIPPIYAVSAEQGLHARQKSDLVALNASGIPALEQALVDFLLNERRQEFLSNVCNRIEEIMSLGPVDIALAGRLDALRTSLAKQKIGGGAPASIGEGAISSTVAECEFCHRIADDVFAFLARYQAQLRRDGNSQNDLAARGGLCAPHTWQFEALAAPREVCTGFAAVLNHQAQRLRRTASKQGSSSFLCEAVERTLPTEDSCPACGVARSTVSTVIAEIGQSVGQPAEPSLQSLSAICLPHLGPLLEALPSDVGEALLIREAEILERLSDDMRRFALKQDAAKRHLASQEELSASRRGLRMILRDPTAETGPQARLQHSTMFVETSLGQ